MWKKYVLPFLVWILYRLWTGTWRVQLHESAKIKSLLADGKPIIFAHWHGDELGIINLVSHYRIATMTSTSSDGSLVDFVIRRLGGATSRGSSTRGGVGALKGLVKLLGQGYRASIAVDGPKGPIYQVKPGVFELSRLGRAYILPVGVSSKNPIVFKKSWNQARLPKPFAKVIVTFAEPIDPISKGIDIRSPELLENLKQKIFDANHQSAKLIALN
ncbi:MAG: lysophospholipid acyltransferase family protein [Bdellovibrionales bacterium]|nr:lysophospholipid acyltransferase family protein [Bdellovibrionales bacterium]